MPDLVCEGSTLFGGTAGCGDCGRTPGGRAAFEFGAFG